MTLQTKALLLTTYMKFLNLYPEEAELISSIRDAFRQYAAVLDAEVQQRAVEYTHMTKFPQLMTSVWDVMPPFPDRSQQQEKAQAQAVQAVPEEVSRAAEQPPQPESSPAQNGVGNGAGPAAPPAGPPSAVALLNPRNRELFTRLCLVGEGVLYEDEFLQIGVRSSYQQMFGRIMLYYGNVTPAPITNFSVSALPHTGVAVQAQATPPQIEGGVQLQQPIVVTCNQEFFEPPALGLQFVSNGRPVQLMVPLPLALSKFIEPLQLNKDDFFHRWRQISAAPLEAQAIVKSLRPIDLAYVGKIFSTGFHLAVLAGVDPNTNNLVAAGTFFSTSKQVVCMARIESNPGVNMYRVTIRTFHGPVTDILKGLIVPQLGELMPNPPQAPGST
jgi:AP-2 complex subunit alpha